MKKINEVIKETRKKNTIFNKNALFELAGKYSHANNKKIDLDNIRDKINYSNL